MKWNIRYTESAWKDLSALDLGVARKIVLKIRYFLEQEKEKIDDEYHPHIEEYVEEEIIQPETLELLNDLIGELKKKRSIRSLELWISKNRKRIKKLNDDNTAYNCLKYVIDNIKWISDSKQFGFKEHWDFPSEVIYRKKADCEGGSHLIVSLMRNAEIPAFRTKVVCGWTYRNNDFKQRIGHSYAIYLRETDNQWVTLDWCWYPNEFLIKDRVMSKDNPSYGPIWWTFNDKFSWSQNRIDVQKELKKVK